MGFTIWVACAGTSNHDPVFGAFSISTAGTDIVEDSVQGDSGLGG